MNVLVSNRSSLSAPPHFLWEYNDVFNGVVHAQDLQLAVVVVVSYRLVVFFFLVSLCKRGFLPCSERKNKNTKKLKAAKTEKARKGKKKDSGTSEKRQKKVQKKTFLPLFVLLVLTFFLSLFTCSRTKKSTPDKWNFRTQERPDFFAFCVLRFGVRLFCVCLFPCSRLTVPSRFVRPLKKERIVRGSEFEW